MSIAYIPDTPRQVLRMLSDIQERLDELREGYPSDYEAGYAKRRQSFDTDLRPTSDTSDPTGNAVADLEHRRRAVARISLKVGEAHAALDEASAALIKPVHSGRKCPRCRRIIRRPRGMRSGICEACYKAERRKARAS